MSCVDQDEEFKVGELPIFLQGAGMLDNGSGLDFIDLGGFLDKEEELYAFPDDESYQVECLCMKTCDAEDIECLNSEISIVSRESSAHGSFLNSILDESIASQENSMKPAFSRIDPNPKPKRENKISKCQNNEDFKLSDEIIECQARINYTLEKLLKTMERTKQTRNALKSNSNILKDSCHNLRSQKVCPRNIMGVSSLTLNCHPSNNLPNNFYSMKNNVASHIINKKESILPFKRSQRKSLCKFIRCANSSSNRN